MAYVYQFYVGGEVKYVGYTTNIKARMSQHFTRVDTYQIKVIPYETVKSVDRIEYTEVGCADGRVLEAYLIAKHKPEWNTDFVEDDELTFTLDTGELGWKEWEVTTDDNPHHHIFIWKDDELLYEIPKIHEVYDPLCRELGIEQDMNFGYCHAVYSNGYKIMRISGKRRIQTGEMKQKPKYSFMGYPEKWEN